MQRILIVARNKNFPSPLPIREGGPWDGRKELRGFDVHPEVLKRMEAQEQGK